MNSTFAQSTIVYNPMESSKSSQPSQKIMVMEEEKPKRSAKKVDNGEESQQQQQQQQAVQRSFSTLTPNNNNQHGESSYAESESQSETRGEFFRNLISEMVLMDAIWVAVRLVARSMGY